MHSLEVVTLFLQAIVTLYAFFFAVYALGIKKYAKNITYHSYFDAISLAVLSSIFIYTLMLFIYSQDLNLLSFYIHINILEIILSFIERSNINYFNVAYSIFIFIIGLMFIYAKILLDLNKSEERFSQKISNIQLEKGKVKPLFKITYYIFKYYLSNMGIYGNLVFILMLIFLVLQFPEISFFGLITFIIGVYLFLGAFIFITTLIIFCVSFCKVRLLQNRLKHL
ncbi:hypothetical protein [Methanohalophilus halophilus]|uniref:Uncharacterized protein n=1 Tax=Methanohalophilus halophilus TaxID=2177 RepID=A0A1L3Q036_9EURY|nr:hypothetical protein [Methanohalophilus halophilus]APH38236.1 hypothetical protein BHR79_01205 [Methanohalophilus halophilus]RNI10897.1 hypothetical protein EFE40_01585 [Methanohalophilus halophilus]SDV99944.1 hypothetical protein SAMN04515625_0063 [Methanohalophilus halophilus]